MELKQGVVCEWGGGRGLGGGLRGSEGGRVTVGRLVLVVGRTSKCRGCQRVATDIMALDPQIRQGDMAIS